MYNSLSVHLKLIKEIVISSSLLLKHLVEMHALMKRPLEYYVLNRGLSP